MRISGLWYRALCARYEKLIAGGSAPAPGFVSPAATHTCGWLTDGRGLWTRTILGPRPAGNLRLSKFDPIEFVFVRAKTILRGAKLGALRAPAGPAPGMVRA